jgi:uncharacterized protein YjbI with pentapeptide repeats
LARGRTLVVFDAVSAFRQVRALRFLYEAGLIQAAPGKQPVIPLDNTSLPGIQLPGRHFLSGAHLHQANLSEADLDHADLGDADLTGADLSDANLEGANVTDEQLAVCESLQGATMPGGTKHP